MFGKMVSRKSAAHVGKDETQCAQVGKGGW